MATSTSSRPHPSPAIIFETLNAYQRTAALRAAIELNVFTTIADGNTTAAEIAHATQTSERGTRILCDYLTVMGFLGKNAGHYELSPESALFLSRHSPAYLGTTAQFLGEMEEKMGAGKDMAQAVRQGGTTLPSDGTMSYDNPIWVTFARSMAPMMSMPAEKLALLAGAPEGRNSKVLDIAAGHGLYGIAVARHNPNAHIVAVDWANVLDVAWENARQAGVADRYSSIAGSAFDVDFGDGYDLVLLTNFLHHFSAARNEELLKKICASMNPGGRVLTAEFIPNEDRVTPPVDAMFSMMMLTGTSEGDAYTFSEYETMFRNAGFARSELYQLSPLPNRAVVSYK
ncbi:MAG TPA: class I SAM-dependent methyltransferase [Bryobacteraceae bacterium]|nr:class I SAM-dependent methyltransferase [Bryobacteraceae bacterium]